MAGTELSSNCDVLVGPFGSWIALPLDTHGEISSDVRRFPSRLKSKSAHGARQGASSAGTPSKGGITCGKQTVPTQQSIQRIGLMRVMTESRQQAASQLLVVHARGRRRCPRHRLSQDNQCKSPRASNREYSDREYSGMQATQSAQALTDDEKQCFLPAFACSERFEDVLLAALTCEKESRARQLDKIVTI